MTPVEFLVSLIAPHLCVVCRREGEPLCVVCAAGCFSPSPPACYRCKRPSNSFKTCIDCSAVSPLGRVWVCAKYEGAAMELVHQLKFKRMKAASGPISGRMDLRLPDLPDGMVVCPVPTTSSRVRGRGYDQARLIARGLARSRRLPCRDLLIRMSDTRQVGAGRRERFAQLENAFRVRGPDRVAGKSILLIDDVLTTGATLESAAIALKENGAESVSAAVFAH